MTAAGGDDTAAAPEAPKQPHLAKQDASTVDPAKLTALTPEVVGNKDELYHGSVFLSGRQLSKESRSFTHSKYYCRLFSRFLARQPSMLVPLAMSHTESPLS